MISPNPLGYFVVSISLILKIYFPHPWRSQCLSEHFFVISQRVEVEVTQLCLTLCDPMDCPWNSPGQNTGVGSLFLLQGIFPTQGSNPGLSHCRQILYQLSHKGRFLFLFVCFVLQFRLLLLFSLKIALPSSLCGPWFIPC